MKCNISPFEYQHGIMDNNGKILCKTGVILDQFAGYFNYLGNYNESDRYDNVDNCLNNIDNNTDFISEMFVSAFSMDEVQLCF